MRRLPLVLAVVLVLAACAGRPPLRPLGPAPEAVGDIRGEWLVTELVRGDEPVPLPDGVEGTLTVGPERLSGTAFCNGFGGDYELEEGHLEVRELLSTLMACPGDVGTAEGLYLDALTSFDAQVTLQDGELVLTGDGAELRFVPRPPVSGTWDARPDGVSTAVDTHEADCAGELRAQDDHVAAVFTRGFEARVSRGRLILASPDGRSIEYVEYVDDAAD